MTKFMQFLVKLREYESSKDFIAGDSVGMLHTMAIITIFLPTRL